MWKTDIIDQDHSNLKVATLIEKKEEQLRDRQAALLIFKKQRDSSSHLQMQTSRRPMDILTGPLHLTVSVSVHSQIQ